MRRRGGLAPAGFLASFTLFSAAYALVVALAGARTGCPAAPGAGAGRLAVQALLVAQALRRGLSYETALWMQRRYRLLFALVGCAMLVG